MDNTKSILLVAIITATLVLGTSVIPMQSYADRVTTIKIKKVKITHLKKTKMMQT